MTQSDLLNELTARGERIEIYQTISHWETGRRTVPLDLFPSLSGALRCSMCELLPSDTEI